MVREELRDRTAACGAIRSGGYCAVRCVIYGAVYCVGSIRSVAIWCGDNAACMI